MKSKEERKRVAKQLVENIGEEGADLINLWEEVSVWDLGTLLVLFRMIPGWRNENVQYLWECIRIELVEKRVIDPKTEEIIAANVDKQTRFLLLGHLLNTPLPYKLLRDLGFPEDLDAEWLEGQQRANPEYQDFLREARKQFSRNLR